MKRKGVSGGDSPVHGLLKLLHCCKSIILNDTVFKDEVEAVPGIGIYVADTFQLIADTSVKDKYLTLNVCKVMELAW